MLYNRAQRRPVQMIKVRVRNEDEVDRRQVRDSQPRLAKPLQHKKPPGEIRVHDYVLATKLQEETGVPNKGDAHLPVRNEHRLMCFSCARGHGRMAHQSAELLCALAQGGILK